MNGKISNLLIKILDFFLLSPFSNFSIRQRHITINSLFEVTNCNMFIKWKYVYPQGASKGYWYRLSPNCPEFKKITKIPLKMIDGTKIYHAKCHNFPVESFGQILFSCPIQGYQNQKLPYMTFFWVLCSCDQIQKVSLGWLFFMVLFRENKLRPP